MHSVPLLPLRLHSVAWAAVAIAAFGGSLPARAQQARLEARYVASLAGIPIGKGAWVIDVGEDQYRAAASGGTTGLLAVFAGGQGTGAAQGSVTGGHFVPATYTANIVTDKKTDEVRMTLANGNVKDVVIEPVQPPNPERVPVTEAHRHGVIDPMTGSFVRVAGTGDVLGPDACQNSAAVFDGRMRYDLQLAFKRMDKVKAEKGYQGPVVVCAVYFTPVAGHIPDRKAIKYLADLKTMEVWLAPIANTRILVPFRFSVPTPVGLGVLEATQFVATAQPGRSTAANTKTQ
jgi:hypothetical protein